MSKREWPLRFECGHPNCRETANYRYSTKRDLLDSFELKNYSNGRWRCVRHLKPFEVLSSANRTTTCELIVEQRPYGKFFGSFGFISGPGFKAFAADFPEGAKVIIEARLILPDNATPGDRP